MHVLKFGGLIYRIKQNTTFVWRLMLEMVPTDENLMLRGCSILLMCNFCNHKVESSLCIFFECPYVH
jgi:hypothetical protein